MGVDTWACEDDFPDRLVKAGFSDYLLLELPVPSAVARGRKEKALPSGRARRGVQTRTVGLVYGGL